MLSGSLFRELGIKLEQMRHYLFFIAVEADAIGGFNGRIERFMSRQKGRMASCRGHREISECRTPPRMRIAGVKHALRAGFDTLANLGSDQPVNGHG